MQTEFADGWDAYHAGASSDGQSEDWLAGYREAEANDNYERALAADAEHDYLIYIFSE